MGGVEVHRTARGAGGMAMLPSLGAPVSVSDRDQSPDIMLKWTGSGASIAYFGLETDDPKNFGSEVGVDYSTTHTFPCQSRRYALLVEDAHGESVTQYADVVNEGYKA
ncbi:hypothetical protein [Naasia lichenicola]|uniref:Uncharacterized protein n=1 Tax=Naasia lichenicola TaxID=2565933 RepID=A0A4S4FS47_9MICO|nr:hypothetical protein [Naasia lichenicola]THG33493.1 hypothetical protein E6C64_03930 [Naasia lichenicola]